MASMSDKDGIPFFSGELFRWVLWKEEVARGRGMKKSDVGWRRKISYTLDEYGELLKRVTALRTRLEVSAVDMEKCAWVLGVEGIDVEEVDGLGEAEEYDTPEQAAIKKAIRGQVASVMANMMAYKLAGKLVRKFGDKMRGKLADEEDYKRACTMVDGVVGKVLDDMTDGMVDEVLAVMVENMADKLTDKIAVEIQAKKEEKARKGKGTKRRVEETEALLEELDRSTRRRTEGT